MPKVEIDYSNTIFYKIYCVNPDIIDIYIGHTTNFIQRKHGHKQCCINTKSINYNSKLYKYIRSHGGWDNWNMEIIAFHNCKDKYAARTYEQKYFKEYKATLNSIQPLAPPKIKLENERENKKLLHCSTCNVYFSSINLHEVHNKTKKHINGLEIMLTSIDNKSSKPENVFNCLSCDYKCRYKCDFIKHNRTPKHIRLISVDNKSSKPENVFNCECGKKYKSRQGLQQHKKKCTYIEEKDKKEEGPDTDYKELLVEAMKQMKIKDEQVSDAMNQMKKKDEQVSDAMNQMKKKDEQVSDAMNKMIEHQKQITDMIPLIGNKTTNNNSNNTTNNKFNLNFFLNTQCKDAMSIQSFMENLSIGSKELEHMGDVGYLNGMIDIFNNTIGNMDIHKRPLHCTDKKREVLYFKQGDEWEKDSTDKQQLKKLIKNVENKNYYNVREWSKAHKESFTSETAAGDQYVKIATEALGGADSTKDTIYLSKIMKHIIREVTVKV
jgi:hypothetical protein